MKPLYALVLVLIYTTIVQSQVQSVIGNTGGVFKNDDLVIEFTLGETIINTFSNNRHVVTQGFHQPDIRLSTSTIAYAGHAFDISVYPNPFQSHLTITIDTDDHPIDHIDLMDIHGRIIHKENASDFSNGISIDGSRYASGVYFIQYRDSRGNAIHSEKILKL